MKLLIRATNWVGDAIMALPALRTVRHRFPDAQIAILARPYVAEIYRNQGVCDELLHYDWKGKHLGRWGRGLLISELRTRAFDKALLLQNAFDAAWLAWRAQIPERVGYARDARSLLLTNPVPVPKPGEIPAHEKFYYLELLRRAGWIDSYEDVSNISLQVPDSQKQRAWQMLVEAGSRPAALRVAIGAGASYGSAKCWLPERFAAVATKLQSERNADIILFGTPGEAAVSAAIRAGMKWAPIDLTGKTEIAQLPGLLSQCHLFIGNDSGAMHVAGAVGLPVVGVFGPTDPHGTSPVTPKFALVQQQPYCSPCFLRKCPTDHRCMKSVTPEMVEEPALRMLPKEVPSA